MDANGLRFWMTDGAQFTPAGVGGVETLPDSRRIRLASTRDPGPDTATKVQSDALLAVTPQTLDAYGARARWDAASGHVLASGPIGGDLSIYAAGAGDAVSDL